jgi:tRNA (guanine-N(7)-)-methyltransferase subunit TRM82
VNEVIVACEGQPALFSFNIATGANMTSSIPLQGNPLGVAFIQTSQDSSTMIVSVDNVHKPGSTTEIRDDQVSKHFPRLAALRRSEANTQHQGGARLQCFSRQGGKWRNDSSTEEAMKPFVEEGSRVGPSASSGPGPMGSGDDKAVRDIIYHVENLRKRPGAED